MSNELLFKVSCLNKLNQIDGINWTSKMEPIHMKGMWRKRDVKNNKIFWQALM